MFRPRRGHKRFLIRRAVGSILVAALVVSTLGIPLPGLVEKTADEPYPCMHCACGCHDAETCWQNCCCFTDAQKLAWALENGVEPPSYVRARYTLAVSRTTAKPSCCNKGDATCEKNAPTPRQSRSLVMFQALGCRGLHGSLTSLPPSIMPLSAGWVERSSLPPESIALVDQLFSGRSDAPAAPPPRQVG